MKRLLLFVLIIMGCVGRIATEAKRLPNVPAPMTPVEPLILRSTPDEMQCLQWVDSVLKGLSLRERIGQLFIYTIAPERDKANRELLRKVVKDYKVGGLLFSGGEMQNQAILTNEAQGMADIPLMITFDGEWGLSMRLKNTPVFPRNMILGCIQNDSLIYEYGREMARQCKEMGVQVNFAPVADVNINPKNPVIDTRSFGDNPENVAAKIIAYAKGLEDGGVLSVAKHFPGHGDTDVDSHKALPRLPFTRERLDSIELIPFKKAIQAGLSGMMVGHLEVSALEPQAELPSSLSHRVVNDLLKEELKFQGLTFTDALAMKGVSNNESLCLKAIKAGNDLLLVPRRLKEEVEAVVKAVKKGELSEKTIEDKCRKVLTYKYALGLSKKPKVQLSGLDYRINTPYARDLIHRLSLAAITVLEDSSHMLPLDPTVQEIAVLNVGEAGKLQPLMEQLSQYVHPTEFRLEKNLTEAGQKALKKKLASYKRILVCVTEQKLGAYRPFLGSLSSENPMIYLFFVQGKYIAQIEQAVSAARAVVLAHTTEESVQQQVAKILYADAPANGRLSAGIGKLFASGEGISLIPQTEPRFIPEEHGMSSRLLACIDTIAEEGIREGAYPGCQVVILKDGKRMYDKTFGTHTWSTADTTTLPVLPTDVYDIASLTKTTATLLAVMKLYDKGRLSLTDRLSDYLPYLKGTDKRNITVRDALFHQSGLPSTLLFYEDAIDKNSYDGTLFKGRADRQHTVRIGKQTWANPNFHFRDSLISKVHTEDEYTLPICDSLWLNPAFKKEYLQKIIDKPLKDKRYRYSCIGFILLQQLVEARTGMSIDQFLNEEFYMPMGLKRTGYLPLRFVPRDEIVPSSIDSFLRKTTLQGYVHDESAAFLGGVAGNAGLFSTAEEVARIYQMLLNGGELDGKRYLSQETCKLFTTAKSKISRRGLGFDRPDTVNPQKSPCAPSAPASVYGHIGFTGTCAWVDPDNGLIYVFLSNRIYPHVWNTKLMKLDIRGRIQEAMYQALLK